MTSSFSASKSDKTDNANKSDSQLVEPDPEAFSHRLRNAADLADMGQAELCRRTGTKRQSMTDYWAGKRLPGSDRLYPIADTLKVSPRWLLYGVPDMISDVQFDPLSLRVWLPLYDLAQKAKGNHFVQDNIQISREWMLKIFGEITDNCWLSESPGRFMRDRVQLGDLLIFEDFPGDLVDGRYYALSVDKRPLIRRVEIKPGSIILREDEYSHSNLEVSQQDFDKSILIIGHLIGVYSLRAL